MNKKEYINSLKSQFEVIQEKNKELVKEKNKNVISGLYICGGIFAVSLLLSMMFSLSTFFDFIFEISGIGLGLLVLLYFYNNFKTLSFPKKTLSYLIEESKFQYKPTYAKREVFINNLFSYGFNSLFVRINDKVVCLDAKVKEPGKNEIENVLECRVNFSDPMNVHDFLDYNIDGIRLGNIEKFELLSINFDDPMNFITK